MNTKRFFAAIFAAAILSISFLACDPKEDDPTTNPTPSTDVVKEVYGFFGKSTDEVVAILDQKGLTKSVISNIQGVVYTYLSADSLKLYAVFSINDTIKGSAYGEQESTSSFFDKLASNTNRFLSLFEKWENSLSIVDIFNATYRGSLYADDYAFMEDYDDRALFLQNFQIKKSTLNAASSHYYGDNIKGYVEVFLDYDDNESDVSVVFEDNSIMEEKGKTTKNSWFRK